ncbi:MAG: GMC family oxidoreductase [Flavobacteriales bacterium]|jgi:choline dehydrogenase-like flavoprotein|nr:GMC family oxidoreductase [Flavobacteriales bacterium]
MHVAVVGSGPAGYFCAKALSARGIKVTILDVGKELKAERQDQVNMLAATPRNQWPPEIARILSENPTISSKGLPRKLLFGSDYAYQHSHPFYPCDNPNMTPSASFAKGGFSNLWGGSALPASDCDIKDWPIKRNDLEPFYKKVMQILPLSGGEGNLEDEFPSWKETLGKLQPGSQQQQLLKDLSASKKWLHDRGILYGEARLAIHSSPSAHSPGCNSCGFCLSGCPQNAVFNTSGVLDDLCRNHKVEYKPNRIVHRVQDDGSKVTITLSNENSGERCKESYDAVFLAAGVINTTRILLTSKEIYNQTVTLNDSQKFILPVLRLNADKDALADEKVTFSRVFIEAKMKDKSDHWVHVQLSPINDMFLKALKIDPFAPKTLRCKLLSPLLKRTMIALCGLHSDHSDKINLKLIPTNSVDNPILHIREALSPKGKQMAWWTAKRLFTLGMRARTMFIPYPQIYEPGAASHCGGSFPMRKEPKEYLDSDVFGRVFGWKNVYAVDSSIFPSIPGTTIALNIMANAYRIGETAPLAK